MEPYSLCALSGMGGGTCVFQRLARTSRQKNKQNQFVYVNMLAFHRERAPVAVQVPNKDVVQM